MIMRKHSILALIAVMMCLPLALQAKVEHLLPKVHVLKETKGTPFALKRTVTITDATNSAALKRVFMCVLLSPLLGLYEFSRMG